MRFLRNRMFLGDAAIEKLKRSHVAVVGIGGVGSWAAEALIRCSIGSITLVDSDCVSQSNINRQLIALTSTVGKPKVEVMAQRALDINPEINVFPLHILYNENTRESFFCRDYDYIIDAIDLVSAKLDLIETALSRGYRIISAMGTGNKSDPTAFRVTDISKTQNCPLARVMRRELRERGILHHEVVYSPEKAITPLPLESPPPGRRSIPASLPWVPSSAGLLLAAHVVGSLTADIQSK